jgi:hypothetical protein
MLIEPLPGSLPVPTLYSYMERDKGTRSVKKSLQVNFNYFCRAKNRIF